MIRTKKKSMNKDEEKGDLVRVQTEIFCSQENLVMMSIILEESYPVSRGGPSKIEQPVLAG